VAFKFINETLVSGENKIVKELDGGLPDGLNTKFDEIG